MTEPVTDTNKMDADVRWNLADLYASPTDPQLQADLDRSHQLALAFASRYRGRVASLSPAELLSALQEIESIYTLGYKPQGYAFLAFSAQTQDPQLRDLLSRVREASTQTFNELVFFEVELKAMPEEAFQRFLAAPELANYHHYLRQQRAFAPHTLSEPEERLLSQLRLTGAAAWSQLYTEITSALRFPIEVKGEHKELTDAELRALRTEPDRDLRRRATECLYTVYQNNGQVITYIFNTLFQDHKINVGLRNYSSVIEPNALENELSPEVIEGLMSAVEAHYPMAQEYLRLKAKLLGLSGDFHYYDVLAPYEAEERRYTFTEARELVLSSYERFSPRFRQIASEFFDQAWIDGMPRPGKRGGAFCSGLLPAYHPYVLTNFTSRLDDVFTLAHELGHGIHFELARQQTPLNYDPTIPMAELASVFGEILLARYLREREPDPALQRNILSRMIEEALSTIFRQVMYTRWEQRAHARRAEGVATPEDYGRLWMEESHRLYGDDVIFAPLDRWGWATIPHFISYRFYCYSYAFGHLLTFALYQKYLDEGEAFIPGYTELLTSGGKDRPENLLKAVGLNPLEPGFWDRGFHVLQGLLDDFRRQVGQEVSANQ